MDRDKAIDRLKAIKVVYALTPTANEALDLAIEALQESQTTHDQMDACYMAQKSAVEKLQLSGETPTNDCISRQQAIEAIEKEIERIRENPCAIATEGDFYYQNALKLAQEIIELQPPVTPTDKVVDFNNMISGGGRIRNLPPVTPTERTGEWIVYPLKDEGRVELDCPKCGYALIRAADRRPHFCENCGAKMGGDTE